MRYLDTEYIIKKNWNRLTESDCYKYLHFEISRLIDFIVNLNVLDKKSKVLINLINDKRKLKVSHRSLKNLQSVIDLLSQVMGTGFKFDIYNTIYFKDFINYCFSNLRRR